MRPCVVGLLVLAASAAFLLPSASAGKPSTQQTGSTQLVFRELAHDFFSAVDYESGSPVCDPGSPNSTGTCDPAQDVYNPGVVGDPVLPNPFQPVTPTCAWDSDDALSIYGAGILDAGASAQYSFCVIHDSFDHPQYSRHPTHVWLYASTPTLDVRIENDYDPTLDVTAPPPVLQPDGSWLYQACFERRVGVVGQQFPVIEFSNGGTGVRVQTTVRVTNLSLKTTARKITGYVTNGFYNNPYLLWRTNGCA